MGEDVGMLKDPCETEEEGPVVALLPLLLAGKGRLLIMPLPTRDVLLLLLFIIVVMVFLELEIPLLWLLLPLI